ncbi:MAG: ATP-binding protein [Nitrosopumilus sp.]
MEKNKKTRIFKFLIIPSIILSLLFVATKFIFDWQANDVHHFYFEIIAVVFDALIAFYCINRAITSKEKLFVFLGVGFVASAMIDGMHAAVSLNAIDKPVFLAYFIPQTWAASRLIDAVMLFVAFSRFFKKDKIIEKFESIRSDKSTLYSIVIIFTISISAIVFSISTPLPNIVVDFPIHRPFDVIAAVAFFGSLVYYIKKRIYLRSDPFFTGLGIFLVINLFAESMISLSAVNFDTEFNVAHILKDVSYFVILVSLFVSGGKQIEIKNKLTTQLERSSKHKEEYASMIAHELKTPLTPIQGYADLLLSERSGKLNEKQKRQIKLIKDNAITLHRLISDFTDAQKLELRVLKLNKKRIHLADAVKDSIINLRQEIEKCNIALTTSLEEQITCVCDKQRISQVLNNLLTNSMDFCPKSNGKINISLQSLGKNAEIIVEDNGIGMSEEQISKVGTKFYQADSSMTREYGGTGLGFSIIYGIVEGHGGTIKIESKIGKGTKVHIILPKKSSLDKNTEIIQDEFEIEQTK